VAESFAIVPATPALELSTDLHGGYDTYDRVPMGGAPQTCSRASQCVLSSASKTPTQPDAFGSTIAVDPYGHTPAAYVRGIACIADRSSADANWLKAM
jgi:hypothetical protein